MPIVNTSLLEISTGIIGFGVWLGYLSSMKILMTLVYLFCLNARADIFGRDDRTDVLLDSPKHELGRSVAVGVLNSLWTDLGGGASELWTDPLSEFMCSDERFNNQASVSYACTGFLVGEDLLVTAGHCGTNTGEMRNSSENYCEAYTWLFDYRADSDVTQVSDLNIYKCKEIIYAVQQEVDGHSHDFALVRLDRKVEGRSPLKFAQRAVRRGERVTMLGHPMGLPLKYTFNARVFKEEEGRSFLTNLDAFAGNSGSPVFNTKNEVVGVLIAGNPALATYRDPKAGCDRFNRCDENGRKCTSLPDNNSADGFPHTFSEVQSIFHYKELINSSKL